jgi:hypothetical protein
MGEPTPHVPFNTPRAQKLMNKIAEAKATGARAADQASIWNKANGRRCDRFNPAPLDDSEIRKMRASVHEQPAPVPAEVKLPVAVTNIDECAVSRAYQKFHLYRLHPDRKDAALAMAKACNLIPKNVTSFYGYGDSERATYKILHSPEAKAKWGEQ